MAEAKDIVQEAFHLPVHPDEAPDEILFLSGHDTPLFGRFACGRPTQSNIRPAACKCESRGNPGGIPMDAGGRCYGVLEFDEAVRRISYGVK